MQKKCLQRMEPFNDVFYIDCFYNSLFSVTKHFNRSNNPVLVNDIFIFKYRLEKGLLHPGMKTIQIKNFEELRDVVDVYDNSIFVCDTLVETIKNAINLGNPVIIWIDCFYSPIRKDVYQKYHWAHTLLVYGYDDSAGIFNIIEHEHRENLMYKHKVLEYEIVNRCNRGYVEHFHHGQFPTYHEFFVKKKNSFNNIDNPQSIIEARKILLENIQNYREDIVQNMDSIESFLFDYRSIVADMGQVIVQIPHLIERLNKIINFRRMEEYRLLKIMPDETALACLQKAIEAWNQFRLVLAKAAFSSKYKMETIYATIEKLEAICEYEKRYNDYITHKLGRSF